MFSFVCMCQISLPNVACSQETGEELDDDAAVHVEGEEEPKTKQQFDEMRDKFHNT